MLLSGCPYTMALTFDSTSSAERSYSFFAVATSYDAGLLLTALQLSKYFPLRPSTDVEEARWMLVCAPCTQVCVGRDVRS